MTTLLLTPLSFFRTVFNHLWLSVSSVEFYERVFKKYKGYGVKYIFTLALMSALICTTIFLYHANKVRAYFSANIIETPYIENMDHVLQQLPEIEYDGARIFTQDQAPLFLYNINNEKVVVIDLENQLKPADRGQIPVILTAETMVVNLLNEEKRAYYTLPLEYTKIFGDHSQILTQDIVRSSLGEVFDKTPWLFIYLLFPVLTVMIFVNILLEKLFIILMIYLMTRFSGLKASLQASIRMVLFASGVFVLFQFVFFLLVPYLSTVLWIVQIWANFLMILGILRASGRITNLF